MRVPSRELCLLFLFAGSIACSKSSADPGEDPGTDGGGGGFGKNDAGSVTQLPQCAEQTKDIFLISEDESLYQFHPPTVDLKNLGRLSCPAGGAKPTSMAVDRQGVAWVRYSDATLWKVSTVDLSCAATKFVPPSQGFIQFGMGFATESAGGVNEVLYISDHDGAGLGAIDTDTTKFRFIGNYDGDLSGKTSELTGTGDGKLYGFFVTSPTQLAEISKGTGKITPLKVLDGVFAGTAWAFSFYGGDFYVYTTADQNPNFPQAGGNSKITRYRPSTQAIEVVRDNVGFKIVGAGVSTCAPTSSPH